MYVQDLMESIVLPRELGRDRVWYKFFYTVVGCFFSGPELDGFAILVNSIDVFLCVGNLLRT